MKSLTDAKIRASKPQQRPYKLPAGHGLYLEVRPTGSRLWRYRYRIGGKENLYALGEYAERPYGEKPAETAQRHNAGKFTLAEAQIERVRCRDLVKQGIHPVHEKRTAKAARQNRNANTFESVARDWIEDNRKNWTPRYTKQIERTFKDYVYTEIGTKPLRSVSSADLLELVKKIDAKAPTIALLARQWCGAVFRYAIANLKAEIDPTIPIRGAVTRPTVKNKTPLELKRIPALVAALNTYGGSKATAIALKLLLYIWVRPGELRAAAWSEFDLDEALFRIPAQRMKMREPHLVPLPSQAVALLRQLHELTGGGKLLFPNRHSTKRPIAPGTLNCALDNMGYTGKFSPHAFRATASTALNEAGFRPDLIERQLAHAERNQSRASYNRAEYLDERREMLQQWADMVDAQKAGGEVTPIGRKKRAA
jgi:integrase